MKKMKEEPVVIIGAGSVGSNAALLLKKCGVETILLETADDILPGSPRDTFIYHGDGFEYHHPDHQKTGENCIDGAIFQRLLYNDNMFQTTICHTDNPIRFFVSHTSATPTEKDSHVPVESFIRNAEHMREHFRKRYNEACTLYGEEEAKRILGRTPDSFARHLAQEEYQDVGNVAVGYAGSSSGVNMPHYYAVVKAALKENGVDVRCNSTVETIEQQGKKYVITRTNGEQITTPYILLASGHGNPALVSKIQGSPPSVEGTYYLNTMAFVKLPATADQEKIAQASHINFTLQQEHGCAYTCVVPPTIEEDGMAVIYYPSPKGNQVEKHTYSANHPVPPDETRWTEYMNGKRPLEEERIKRIMQQAYHFYPFLKDYAIFEKTVCRTVFNGNSPDSELGLDRRVRDFNGMHNVAENIGVVHAPKWTTATVVAATAADHILTQLGKAPLPKNEEHGFGPASLDCFAIARDYHFRDVRANVEDARHYAREMGIPERIVNPNLPCFSQVNPLTPPATEITGNRVSFSRAPSPSQQIVK